MVVNRLPNRTANGNRLRDAGPAESASSTGKMIQTVEQLITNYPQAALGTAVLCGVLLGCLIKRR